MRYIIYGAGAIGGTIGARLQLAGFPVVFIARGGHLESLRSTGLAFATPEGVHELDVSAAANAAEAELREDDFIFLAVKSQDTAGALDDIRGATGGRIAIACAQNGVANERLAARFFERVYATVVMLPASHLRPGAIQCESAPTTGILDTGRYPSGIDDLCVRVCGELEQATFSARPDGEIMRQKYRKLLMNLNNSIGALCGRSEAARDLSRMCRREADAVYRAAGIDSATDEEFLARREGLIQVRPVEGRERAGSSSWQSLERGTGRIEADYLNGEIVLLGRLHGVATPANRVLQEAAAVAAASRAKPESVDATALLAKARAL
ncbi:MAG: ketopantoate reductase family protein [Dehalococcoidia bacterium]